MKTRIRVLTVLSTVMVLVFACNLPGLDAPLSTEEQAATLVAQTLNAVKETEGAPVTLPANTPTRTPGDGPPATITQTGSATRLKVDEPTNCRSGPGANSEVVTVFQAGAEAEIVGRSQASDWWLINNPFGSGTCWIAAEFAEITGNGSAVQVVTPAPPADADAPPPPSISNWDFSCAYDSGGPNVTFNLRWSDRAADETGYRIYRNNELVSELPPNSSSFSEVVSVESNEQLTYRLEVYNNAGASSASLIQFSCQ
jgi:hypothetical protein